MRAYYLDTSALIKRYDTGELGGERVRSLCKSAERTVLLTSELTGVETASAFSRKTREKVWSPEHERQAWRLFRAHRRHQYQVLTVTEKTVARAERLVAKHILRAYDALHLAAALESAPIIADLGALLTFVTADKGQARAAEELRLATELVSG